MDELVEREGGDDLMDMVGYGRDVKVYGPRFHQVSKPPWRRRNRVYHADV
jgi:hypothetical protein